MFREIPFRRIVTTLVCVALFNSSKAAPQWYPKDLTPPKLPAATSFNEEAGHGDSLFITVRSESGEDWVFGVDTGSPVTMLDNSLEGKLGKRLSEKQVPTGWLGTISTGVFRSPKLFLNETPLLLGENVWTTDLSRMSSAHRMMGILGMDCLHHYCLQLDFATHKIFFLNPEAAEASRGNAFPLTVTQAGVAVKTSFINTNKVESGIDSAEYLDGSLKPDQFQTALKENPQGARSHQRHLRGRQGEGLHRGPRLRHARPGPLQDRGEGFHPARRVAARDHRADAGGQGLCVPERPRLRHAAGCEKHRHGRAAAPRGYHLRSRSGGQNQRDGHSEDF